MRKFVLCCVVVVLCIFLAGCDIFTADTAELLSPPALSGDISPIAEAITASAGGEYTLKYPSKGNFRSAVVQNDINGDGTLEAIAFYSLDNATGENPVNMVINLISNNDGKWVSSAQQRIVAGGVDRIDFCDLDGDGVEEILVGWEIYGTSEMQVAVYSFKGGELIQRMLQKYTNFVCCDLDQNGTNEIMLIKFNAAEGTNSASVYSLTESGVTELYSCPLDKTVQSVGEPIVATLSSGRPAVYIDEVKGVGAITEVLFVEKNALVNPLMNPESGETLQTLHNTNITVKDINGDGIPEIPIQENVPSISKSALSEKLYFTNWCSYNGEALTSQMTTMINNNDGYYYILSQKWAGQIAVLKDTELRVREIYTYNNETLTAGESLVTFKTVDAEDWQAGKYSRQGYKVIMNDELSYYLCKISEKAAASGITIDTVKQNFKLLE